MGTPLVGNKCYGCGKNLTYYDTRVTDGTNSYHGHCFICREKNCHASLAGKPFFSVGYKRVCKKCYVEKHAQTCDYCKQKIVGGRSLRTYEGRIFHSECFKCFTCGRPIASAYKKDRSGNYVHSQNCLAETT
ncbi:four and a half LIM domains protein 1-like [Convolutriloba macropyga]|uniref:four and a half LIM domains protein 1-like n=1 Tax=Convolutriloba macropyga TaxID=536237 RepID=UPI003F51FDA9